MNALFLLRGEDRFCEPVRPGLTAAIVVHTRRAGGVS